MFIWGDTAVDMIVSPSLSVVSAIAMAKCSRYPHSQNACSSGVL